MKACYTIVEKTLLIGVVRGKIFKSDLCAVTHIGPPLDAPKTNEKNQFYIGQFSHSQPILLLNVNENFLEQDEKSAFNAREMRYNFIVSPENFTRKKNNYASCLTDCES